MKTLLLTVLLLLGQWGYGFSIPPLSQPVVDTAGMIHSQTAATLNQELAAIYQSGGPQIAVLTLQSLEDQTIEERAIQVFDQWKIGKKGKDDGVLILIAKKERKVRIEVGYGLEGDIPDAYAKRIVEDVMLPQFRNGQFTTGVVLGIQQIAHFARIRVKSLPSVSGEDHFQLPADFWMFFFLSVVLAFLYFRQIRRGYVSRRSGSDDWGNWGGGGGGWGGGGFGGGFGGGGGWGGGGGSSGGGGASGGW